MRLRTRQELDRIRQQKTVLSWDDAAYVRLTSLEEWVRRHPWQATPTGCTNMAGARTASHSRTSNNGERCGGSAAE